jgi:putative intracellular protease/amidase
VLIGGSGAVMYWEDSLLHAKCEEFVEAGRIVASIGLATIALTRSELMEGRKVAVYRDRGAVRIVTEDQAVYADAGLVEDGPFITAVGTEQADDFGRAIVAALDRRGR